MVSWSLASSIDKEYIFELAESWGWRENRVQVKRHVGLDTWYIIEPYEEGCSCPDLVYPPEEEVK